MGDADPQICIGGDVFPVKPVQPPDLRPQQAVEGAVDPPEFVHSSPEGGPQNLAPPLLVQGKLHLYRQAHPRPGRGLVDAPGQEPGQRGHPNVLPAHHPALAEGSYLFAHRHTVPRLVHRGHIPAEEGQIVLPHPHKVGADAVAEIPPALHGDDQILAWVMIVFHALMPPRGLIGFQDRRPPPPPSRRAASK